MKIPASMMDDMLSTVLASLPYEKKFTPKSGESKVLLDLFTTLKGVLPAGLEGHLYFHLKHIDAHPKQQASIRSTLVQIYPILEQFFLDALEEDGLSHEL